MLTVLLLALAGAAPPGFEAVTAAGRVSPRPAMCREARNGAWFRALPLSSQRHCRALARGYAVLGSDPKQAFAHAEEAALAVPRSGPALVLRARALARLGQLEAARVSFAAAREQHEPSLIAASFEHARVLAALGRWQEADLLFSLGLPLRRALGVDQEPAVLFEAAAAALLGEGSSATERATNLVLPVFRGAPQGSVRSVAGAFLGLLGALSGDAGPTRAAPPELDVESFIVSAREQRVPEPLVELVAAWLVERSDARQGRARWEAIAAAGGTGATLARKRIEVWRSR